MAKSSKKPGLPEERIRQIREDARSGRNWAQEEAEDPGSPSGPYGPTCICGAGLRTFLAARAFKGLHGRPTGFCSRHPGGSVVRQSDWRK